MALAVCFDIWMSRKGQDIMSLDAHYIDKEWTGLHSQHLGLIDCSSDTSGHVLARKTRKLLKKHGVEQKTAAMVRDGGENLRTATVALGEGVPASVTGLRASPPLSCTALGGAPPRMIPCFAHAINGACNGAVKAAKHYKEYRVINVADCLKKLSSIVTYTKKSAKVSVASILLLLRVFLLLLFFFHNRNI